MWQRFEKAKWNIGTREKIMNLMLGHRELSWEACLVQVGHENLLRGKSPRPSRCLADWKGFDLVWSFTYRFLSAWDYLGLPDPQCIWRNMRLSCLSTRPQGSHDDPSPQVGSLRHKNLNCHEVSANASGLANKAKHGARQRVSPSTRCLVEGWGSHRRSKRGIVVGLPDLLVVSAKIGAFAIMSQRWDNVSPTRWGALICFPSIGVSSTRKGFTESVWHRRKVLPKWGYLLDMKGNPPKDKARGEGLSDPTSLTDEKSFGITSQVRERSPQLWCLTDNMRSPRGDAFAMKSRWMHRVSLKANSPGNEVISMWGLGKVRMSHRRKVVSPKKGELGGRSRLSP